MLPLVVSPIQQPQSASIELLKPAEGDSFAQVLHGVFEQASAASPAASRFIVSRELEETPDLPQDQATPTAEFNATQNTAKFLPDSKTTPAINSVEDVPVQSERFPTNTGRAIDATSISPHTAPIPLNNLDTHQPAVVTPIEISHVPVTRRPTNEPTTRLVARESVTLQPSPPSVTVPVSTSAEPELTRPTNQQQHEPQNQIAPTVVRQTLELTNEPRFVENENGNSTTRQPNRSLPYESNDTNQTNRPFAATSPQLEQTTTREAPAQRADLGIDKPLSRPQEVQFSSPGFSTENLTSRVVRASNVPASPNTAISVSSTPVVNNVVINSVPDSAVIGRNLPASNFVAHPVESESLPPAVRPHQNTVSNAPSPQRETNSFNTTPSQQPVADLNVDPAVTDQAAPRERATIHQSFAPIRTTDNSPIHQTTATVAQPLNIRETGDDRNSFHPAQLVERGTSLQPNQNQVDTATVNSVTQQLTQAISQRVSQSTLDPHAKIVVALDPPELGKINVSFEPGIDGMKISFQAENTAVRGIVHGNIDSLMVHLEKLGIQVESFEVFSNDRESNSNTSDPWANQEESRQQGEWRSANDSSAYSKTATDGDRDQIEKEARGPDPTSIQEPDRIDLRA